MRKEDETMKKQYEEPSIEVVKVQTKADILLLSDAEIDVGDLIEPDFPEVDIDISGLFN